MITYFLSIDTAQSSSFWNNWVKEGRHKAFSDYMKNLGYKIHLAIIKNGYYVIFDKEEDLTWFLLTL